MLLDLRNENRQKYIFASQDFPVRFTYKEPLKKYLLMEVQKKILKMRNTGSGLPV